MSRILASMFIATAALASLHAQAPRGPLTLEQRLQAENPAALIRAAHTQGDPHHGAALFYQPQLACAKCHPCGDGRATLGPDLARLEKGTTDLYLLESILHPSKTIKKGFENITVVTRKGETLTGLIADETKDAIVLRDLARDGKLVRIRDAIEERTAGTTSIMPGGLVNALRDRREFLDLLRFLIEVAEKGPVRAVLLRPAVTTLQLPAYKKDIDHAGLIASLDKKSYQRGEAIYGRLCVNCHGTKDQPGSLPTSLRFATGKFRNGSDPQRMYQTLTNGFGLMTPQTGMVPRQKYDVIHYIREAYLAKHNPTQYVRIDQTYLDGLPKGSSRGPAGTAAEPWLAMDYGPSLMATFEIGTGGKNFAYKGIAVRLDAGPGGVAKGKHWALYDHDTMRLAAAWSGKGFIDWNGINFNGRHQIHPRLAGKVHFATPIGPGWAEPRDGPIRRSAFAGPRRPALRPPAARWAHYTGLYHHGNEWWCPTRSATRRSWNHPAS